MRCATVLPRSPTAVKGRRAERGAGDGGAPPFRALDKLFKKRLGTKVRNKLVRNRAEALRA